MAMLDDIRKKILQRQYELSKHTVDQSITRDVSMAEVEQAISTFRTEIACPHVGVEREAVL